MFIRGRFCWTSPDKNELMSLLAKAGARFFPHKQHNTARGRRGKGGKEGRGKRTRRRELFAINCSNKNILKPGLFCWKGSQCWDINRQRLWMHQGSSYTVALQTWTQIPDSCCVICFDLLPVQSVLQAYSCGPHSAKPHLASMGISA